MSSRSDKLNLGMMKRLLSRVLFEFENCMINDNFFNLKKFTNPLKYVFSVNMFVHLQDNYNQMCS